MSKSLKSEDLRSAIKTKQKNEIFKFWSHTKELLLSRCPIFSWENEEVGSMQRVVKEFFKGPDLFVIPVPSLDSKKRAFVIIIQPKSNTEKDAQYTLAYFMIRTIYLFWKCLSNLRVNFSNWIGNVPEWT